MSTPAVARRISPMLAVANMEETIAFYQDVLGFTPSMTSPDYSIVQRDIEVDGIECLVFVGQRTKRASVV